MNRKARRFAHTKKAQRMGEEEARARASWEWFVMPVDPVILERYPAVRDVVRVVRNDFYVVQWFEFSSDIGKMIHLAIRSIQGAGTRSGVEPPWRDLQRIKSEVVGPGFEAVQVCPKEHHLMDQADMYHLFVLPLEWPLPFGLHRENGFRREG